MDVEKLYPDRTHLSERAAVLCAAYGDLDNARKWFERTLEYEKLETGEGSTQYLEVANRVENPESLAGWGIGGKKTLVGP